MVDKCLYLIFDWVARSEMGSVILKKGDITLFSQKKESQSTKFKSILKEWTFSSPELKALSELTVCDSSRRPSVRPSVCPCAHTFKHEYL